MASNSSEKGWNNLPLKTLIKILSFLNPGDRRNAANTCRSWSKALDSPDLWRSLGCLFSSTTSFSHMHNPVPYCEGSSTIRITAHCAPWLRRLWIKRAVDADKWDYNSESVTPVLMIFLKRLIKYDEILNLEEFYLLGSVDALAIEEDDILEDLILLLAKFLRTQKLLRIFRIEWKLPVLYGAILLDAVGSSSGSSMKTLSTESCFSSCSARNPRLILKCLSVFTSLVSLHLGIGDLVDETLKLLVCNCKTLKSIRIFCGYSTTLDALKDPVFISPNTWLEVRQSSPQLRVELVLDQTASDIENMRMIVPQEVPLVWLHCEAAAQQVACIEYLNNFKESLETLCLDYYPNYGMELIVDSLVELVQSCSKLAHLRIAAKLPLIIIQQLYNLQMEKKINLQSLNITFQDLNFEEEFLLDSTKSQWEAQFVNLQLDSEYTINWMSEDFSDSEGFVFSGNY